MAPHAEESLHPHPEELSRRISEIDLTNLRRQTDTETGNPPRYSQTELLKLRPTEKNGASITAAEIAEGMKTPHDFPAPPPPTPDDHPATPDDDDNSLAVQAPAEAAKKKKKKKRSSGKNKKGKVAPTGFEGQILSIFL
jgi:hypothetical protein